MSLHASHTSAIAHGSVTPGPAYGATHRVACDADEQARNLSGWKQLYDQLTPGAFVGGLTEMTVGQMTVFCESTSQALRQTCEVRPHAYWFGIPMHNQDTGRIDGRVIAPEALTIKPGGMEFELLTPAAYRILGVVVDDTLLCRHAAEVERLDDVEALLAHAVLSVDARLKSRLYDALAVLLRDTADQPQPVSPVAQHNLESYVLGALFDFGVPQADQSRPERRSKSDQYWIVGQARDYILAYRDRPVAVPELCRQFHVSRRTLQYCFENALGMTPVSYLRAIRLNGVRRDLSTAHTAGVATPATVQHVAAAWGFWNLSQFAVDYRKLFGKRPSDTLRAALERVSTG